ncbi:CENP-B N-terminal DNA-binding domain [Popillia japonica]|uniref:CENP-B N-terminal DNA-binding domain n=1 Tax=Popillia japonica TaxID=7064 RepID=A0AAW1KLK4_POPJA
MPRKKLKYISKDIRKRWDRNAMERTITAVRDNVMGTLKTSKTYNVPRSTLQRLAKKPEAPRKAAQTLLGRKTVLGEELETELVNYILEMESKFYGLTRKDMRQMAYTLATRNDIDNPFKPPFHLC